MRDLPSQARGTGRQIRAPATSLAELTKQAEGLKEARRKEAPICPAREEEVGKATFTNRTVPVVRERFDLAQEGIASLPQVSLPMVSLCERGQTRLSREARQDDSAQVGGSGTGRCSA